MIWKIAKKEFLLNLMTFKFAVGTILCVVLMAVFMPVLVNDYQQRLKDYNENVAANEVELRKVHVYKNITPTVYQPPNLLSVFSEGIAKQINNSEKIELGSTPEINATSAESNVFLSIFPTLDVSLIFKIVVSILALLVAYDVISGERERGTLKLIIAGTISRSQVLFGKILAGLMTLTVPVTIAFIVGLLILLSFPMVDLAGSDWGHIGLIYAASLIFVIAMFNFGLLMSCLFRNSAISLMLALFLWVVFVFVIPNGSAYLAGKFKPLESRERIDGQIKSLWEKFEGEASEHGGKRYTGGNMYGALGAFGQHYWQMLDEPGIEHYSKRYAFEEPLKIRYSDKVAQVLSSYLNNLFGQKKLAKNLSQISPVAVYEGMLTTLAGTDLQSFQYFIERVRTHRGKIVDYIRLKTDNFSAPSYFTTSDDRIWQEFHQLLEPFRKGPETEANRKKAMETFFKWRERKIKETPALNLQDFPQFLPATENLLSSAKRIIPNLLLLVFMSVLFFALSLAAFLRYDVR